MTCIVAVARGGKCAIASDSIGASRASMAEVTNVKLVSLETTSPAGQVQVAIGYTCSWRLGDILSYSVSIPSMTAADLADVKAWMVRSFIPALRAVLDEASYDLRVDEGGVNFLMVILGHVYEVQSDFSVIETVSGYASCGSGSHIALGALHATQDASPDIAARAAVEAAVAHCPTVGGRVHVMEVPSLPIAVCLGDLAA